eukprot:879765-Prorocentrum_minimum.AAC.1
MLQKRTFRSSVTGAYVVGVSVGKRTLGRVVDAFGNPIIDGEDPLKRCCFEAAPAIEALLHACGWKTTPRRVRPYDGSAACHLRL